MAVQVDERAPNADLQRAVVVEVCGFGRPASAALARLITQAKAGGHPLDPVTVVVPSNTAALAARRLLTTGDPSTGFLPRNLANVTFLTPFRLAELLGSTELDGRRPLTTAVLAAAVRATLATSPGMFAEVAEHQSTVEALTAVYAELSRALPESRLQIARATERGGEVARVVADVEARLADYYDEDDLADAATGAIQAGGAAALEPFGQVIWYLPQQMSPSLTRLLGSCLRSASVASVVMALSGDDGADQATTSAVRAAGVHVDESEQIGTVAPPATVRLVSVSDADEEVRHVVREVVGLMESGTRADRIAIFCPSGGSYERTLADQLSGAGVVFNGPATRRLADSVAGRTLLRSLSLTEEGWGRRSVVELLSEAPVRADDGIVPSKRWDEISRRAGVVGGFDDWSSKLLAFEARCRSIMDDAPENNASAARDLRTTEKLQEFMVSLGAATAAVRDADSWELRTAAARQLLVGLLGSENRRSQWTDAEVSAAGRVDEALVRLGQLDEIDPSAGYAEFLSALRVELAAVAGRIGRFGVGVLVAPLSASVGHDADVVFLLGLAEGTCPAIRGDDALLPELDRQLAVAGELQTQDDLLRTQHRHFLAALAGGGHQRVALFPRGDLRGRKERLPSRWLLDLATALNGERVFSSDFSGLPPEMLQVVPSYAAGVKDATVHGAVADRDVAALFEAGDPLEHPLAAGDLRRGFVARRSRSAEDFTEWDGNLSGQAIPSPATGTPLSASRLEKWAKCPFSYYLSSVLGVRDRDDPEQITEISPAEKGTLIHAVLEAFLEEVLARPDGPPAPTEKWTSADHWRLGELADLAFEDVEARGLTGRRLSWRRTMMDVRSDLETFLRKDDDHRSSSGVTPIAVELPFGLDGNDPLEITIGNGRVLSFRGKADRVDESDDGGLVVLDYKTGSGFGYDTLVDDPVRAGTALQLGLYAEASLNHFGARPVRSSYWMISPKAKFKKFGYDWTSELRERFLEVVEAIVDGVEGGVFPALPGDYDSFRGRHENCTFCDFDRICPRDREDHQRATASAPELSILQRLQLKTEAQA